ncbi:ribonuclease HI family protein [bacterium]|uniref:Ribonuclease H n=2 Tax=Katanobacteria TaxID=422282 RepID=A0A2M7X2Y3_UNCKA|nr:ribonuclease HI family protein [bacterium]PIP56813.1 MAG: ribonuclease H [candidate division WWE3 bacterium CG22_combo_CG10-13_8_21_14_all_39_12]PJA40488.1 MAG: ribonuclease H [candidate division WWE3 bacterium CG_4_9_14_3_um_filter_39_7]
MIEIKLFTDGGARGNPGPAAAGIVINTPGSEDITFGQYLGEITNNQAEYQALLLGLDKVIQEFDAPAVNLSVYMDSELVIKQVTGEYRIKHPNLIPLHANVLDMIKNFAMIQFVHIPRENNKKADAQVNETLDNHDA